MFHDIEGGFGQGKKAMLVKEIANIHARQEPHINELINNNIKRFKDGIDIINLLSSEDFKIVVDDLGLRTSNRQKYSYLLSERGYAKLLKILEDDVAWEQYEYFNKNVDWIGVPLNEEGISTQNMRSTLKKFEKYEFLTQEVTKTGRLINIVNWELYQGLQEETNKEVTKDLTKSQQTGNKELTTNKNDKNNKNDKEVYIIHKLEGKCIEDKRYYMV